MKTFREIIEPLKDNLSFVNNEYVLVVNTDEKMIYAISQDQEKSEIMSKIINGISSMDSKDVLFGRDKRYGIPTSTYIDRDGSIINIVRDKDKRQVTLSWTMGR